MLKFLIVLTLAWCFGLPQAFSAEALRKIRIASKGGGETLLPYLIPQRLGFYKEEGLDVDVNRHARHGHYAGGCQWCG
jgi:ABC-type nitrate/sulfonate/bicarbonate transport system substrate-binding protein